jgi:TrkA domain protein
VAQEFEASLEIIERVMKRVALRDGQGERAEAAQLPPGLHLESTAVPDGAWIAGRTLAESALRSRTGATLLSVSRPSDTAVHPSPDDRVQAGDVLCLVGSPAQIAAARELLARGPAE